MPMGLDSKKTSKSNRIDASIDPGSTALRMKSPFVDLLIGEAYGHGAPTEQRTGRRQPALRTADDDASISNSATTGK